MSDSEKSDVDARFAEIVAHWNDADLPMVSGFDGLPAIESRGGPAPAEPLTDPTRDSLPGGQWPAGEPHAPDLPALPASSPPTNPGPNPPKGAVPTNPAPPKPPERMPPTHRREAWREHVADEPEEHFEPPPPEPLPAGDLQFWGILVGLCGGPLLLLYLIAFDRDASSLWTATAILLTLGGFGLLVARQPHRRPDDGDDGARL